MAQSIHSFMKELFKEKDKLFYEIIKNDKFNNLLLFNWAIRNDNFDLVKYLYENVSFNIEQDENGFYPIHIATIYSTNILKYFISKKVDINQPTSYKYTPLMMAVKHGLIHHVKLILEHDNSSINNQNIDGNTALHLVAYYFNKAILQLLLENNVNLNIKNDNGHAAGDLSPYVQNYIRDNMPENKEITIKQKEYDELKTIKQKYEDLQETIKNL